MEFYACRTAQQAAESPGKLRHVLTRVTSLAADEEKKKRAAKRPVLIVDDVRLGGGKTELAQGTRSDRKDAKAVIHDTLGPRRPWRGTLSSSDPVPCALSLFAAVNPGLPQCWGR